MDQGMTPPLAARLRPAPAVSNTQAAADQGLRAGLSLALTSLLALALLQYALPPNADAHYWGLDPEGTRQFAAHWGLTRLPKLGPDAYSLCFRLALVTLWCGYALAILAGLQGAKLKARPLLLTIGGAAVLTALFCPPLLSHDVYAYAAHGRLLSLYGQNPYFARPDLLARVGDPAARFITWNWPSVYGPIWTRIEAATAHAPGLWPQVVALKLVEAGALVGAALAGRRLTARLRPGRENLTLLALGLNPTLLLEGPGAGHNDLLLVSLLLLGSAFYLDKKYVPAALCLGLSVGVKLITLAVLPWALMEYGRGRTGRRKLAAIAAAGLLVALPLVLAFIGLWHGPATLAAAEQRAAFGLSAATLALDAQRRDWLQSHGTGFGAASLLVSLCRNGWVVGLYGVLTLWLWRRPGPARWLTAWGVLSAALMFLAMGLPFPWYVTWFWPAFLLRWDRLSLSLSGLCFALSLTWTAGYGVLNR